MSQQILLSISLLASNRPNSIRKCLDSLKPIMEQIPSELILVDTSGSEQIHNILLEYTDQVIPFEWCNDFAKARNAGLEKAKGKWFMFLDDDEWFVEIEPLLRFFQSGEYKRYTCANYLVRNFYDMEYINYSASWVSRMVMITPDTRFRSKIHEYLYPAGQKCKQLPAMAYHSGYVFTTKEDMEKHFERNASLLLKMIEEEPERLRWKVQLAQEYRSIKHWEDLYHFCEKCLEETRGLDNRYDNYDIGTFYAGKMEALIFLTRYEEALQAGEEALADRRNSPLCRIYIYLGFANIYCKMKEYAKAEDYAHKYLKAAREIKNDPVELEDQKSALLVSEALDAIPYKRAYSILIICGLVRKDTKNLKKYLKNLEWDQKIMYGFDGIVEAIVDAAAQMPEEPILVEASRLLWGNKQLKEQYYNRVQFWVSKETEFKRLLHVVAQIDGNHWYPYYARVRVADWDNRADLAEQIREYCTHCANVFRMSQEIIEIADRHEVDLADCYQAIGFDQWKQQVHDFVENASLEEILDTERRMKELLTEENAYSEQFFLRIAEGKACCLSLVEDVQEKRKWLLEYAECGMSICEKYYQPDIWKYSELLPENLQAAGHIAKALTQEESDRKAALTEYKEAIEIYPGLGEGIRNYVHVLEEQWRDNENRRKEELRELKLKVRGEAIRLLDDNRPKEAYQVLQELRKVEPNHLETEQLILLAHMKMLEA